MMNMYDNETIADWDALSAENQVVIIMERDHEIVFEIIFYCTMF